MIISIICLWLSLKILQQLSQSLNFQESFSRKKTAFLQEPNLFAAKLCLPDIYTPFVSEAYRKKQLPAVSNTCETILANVKPHLNSNTKKFLLTCLCAAPLLSYMKQIHYNFTPILSVSFSSLASKQLTSVFLKTYCREQAALFC